MSSVVLKEGILEKKSPAALRGWQKRQMKLHETELLYSDPKQWKPKDGKNIQLADIMSVGRNGKEINISTSKKSYKIRATNDEEAEAWAKIIGEQWQRVQKLGPARATVKPGKKGDSTNYAFVFIKPHANTEKVKAIVKGEFANRGIDILKEGELLGPAIDEKKLIDQHYYAIASKATLMKPSELNVPEDKFKAHFGVEWADTLSSGKAFNALDACSHLGIDATELGKIWVEAQGAKKVVKLGGGFYAGEISSGDKGPVYVLNAFFMSLRSKFTAPGASIQYYSVSFDPDKLSWADFRGKVLGPTDPAQAPADSLRGKILAKWQDFGLKEAPNTSDNGVHASASPFEGLSERLNWLSVDVKDDPFGSQLLQAGMSKDMIMSWTVDPQVNIGDGKKGSLFDALEDINSVDCLEKCIALGKLQKTSLTKNCAFVFIKPHANTAKVQALVKEEFSARGIEILQQGEMGGALIDEKKLIDQHYYAIASKATILKPDQLNVPEDKFKGHFGVDWKEVLSSGKAFNALDCCTHLGISTEELDKVWVEAQGAKKVVKLGGGFYAGEISANGKGPVYVLNAFFMKLRNKFTASGASICWYSVSFDMTKLSWSDFRGKVLGPTDAAKAPADSLRGKIFAKWEELGLKAAPDTSDNGVHASASPFEGLSERVNWLSVDLKDDVFGSQLLQAGMSKDMIMSWTVDPQVNVGNGQKASLFDNLEDMNSPACLEKCLALSQLQLNFAFVFIKPHAKTEKVKNLVKEEFAQRGIQILKEGDLAASVIDEKKLIDQHYYAIASKATLLKPDALNVPEDKWKEQFGVEWKTALGDGKVFNALDCCAHLGISAEELGKVWVEAQGAKKVVKLGGGFYAGEVSANGKGPVYVLNAFFMSLRNKFTAPGASIHYYSVSFDPSKLSWLDFRGKVLGPTDPAKAPADSLRGKILAKWQDLGLKAAPDTSDNGVHASASPFEGLSERLNWLSVDVKDDVFGSQLLQAGVTKDMIQAWTIDPQVNLGDGQKGSLFDNLEDTNAEDCLAKCIQLSKAQ